MAALSSVRLAVIGTLFTGSGPAISQSLPVPIVETCSTVRQAPPSAYAKQTYLYETTADGQNEYLDLYVPVGVTNPPMAIAIHGGSFIHGDKAAGSVVPLTLGLVTLGWEVASINYRLANTTSAANKFPAMFQDAKCALQWLKANGNGDAKHTIVAGVSAGGGIANWIATMGSIANPAWTSPTCQFASEPLDVAGALDLYGFDDFADVDVYQSVANLASWDKTVFGFTVASQKAALVEDSPITHVGSAPPYFIADGLEDPVILPAQLAAFGAALQAANVPTSIIQVPNVGHNFNPFSPALGAVPCTLVAWLSAVRQR